MHKLTQMKYAIKIVIEHILSLYNDSDSVFSLICVLIRWTWRTWTVCRKSTALRGKCVSTARSSTIISLSISIASKRMRWCILYSVMRAMEICILIYSRRRYSLRRRRISTSHRHAKQSSICILSILFTEISRYIDVYAQESLYGR